MTHKTLIDSNILVYSINRSSPKHTKAQVFLNSNSQLVIAHQNILETLRVLTHPKFSNPMKAKEALDAILRFTDALTIISPNTQTIYLTQELVDKYNLKGDKIFDAYLAATALSNDVKVIATDNTRDFKIFEGIKLLNPFTLTPLS